MGREVVVENDKVYTSYYSVVDKYVLKGRQVSISVSSPKGFRGIRYTKLMPSVELLRDYKGGRVDKNEYIKRYYCETLNKLNPSEVYNELKGKVLLCWEKKGEFCHRAIVLYWLKEALGDLVIGGEL